MASASTCGEALHPRARAPSDSPFNELRGEGDTLGVDGRRRSRSKEGAQRPKPGQEAATGKNKT